MERLAITAHELDLTAHIALAREYDIGLEIQVYGYQPNLMDQDWLSLVDGHKKLLRNFEGEIALHGAFFDMISASPDKRVVALARERVQTSLNIAAELGARHVVFHANYLPLIRSPEYLADWTERQVAFWGELIQKAQQLDLVIALENMWEPKPGIIGEVLGQINSPHLGACLDVGHVYIYSNAVPFSGWLEGLEGQIVHCHLNNNPGHHDEHLSLDAENGIINYQVILPQLEKLPGNPFFSLEMYELENLKRSLRYLGY